MTARAEKNLFPVTVQLNWKPQFEFAAFYVAKALGYYRDAGLDVTIRPGGPKQKKTVVELVSEGEAEFGVDYSGAIFDIARGAPVKILEALFAHTPMALAVKGSSDATLYTIDGLDVYLSPLAQQRSAISLLINENDLQIHPHPYDIEAFFQKNKAAIDLFVGNGLHYRLEREDQNHTIIDPAKYGVDFYDDFLIVSKKFWKQHPLLARRLAIETMNAWRYALTHIPETIKILKRAGLPQSPQALRYEARHYLRFAPPLQENFGLLEKNRLEEMVRRFSACNNRSPNFDIYDAVDPLFLDHHNLISQEEREWMASHILRYSETYWPPFTIPLAKGKIAGLLPDYLRLVSQKSGLLFRYVPYPDWSSVLRSIQKHQLDMAAGTGLSEEAMRGLSLFSAPYGRYRYALAQRIDDARTLSDLEKSRAKVAVGRDYTAEEMLKTKHPSLRIVEVPTTKDGLRLLREKRVDAVVDVLPTLKYLSIMDELSPFRLSSPFKERLTLRALFRNDLSTAVTIFNKGLAAIDRQEHRLLLNRWQPMEISSVKVEKKYLRPFLGVAAIALFLGFLLFWIHRENQQRKRVERQLKRTMKIIDQYVLFTQIDREGNVTQVSRAFEAFSGYDRNELLGTRQILLRASDTPETICQDLRKSIAVGKTWHRKEIKCQRKDGEPFWTETTLHPLTNEKGEIDGYIVLRKDISAKKIYEKLSMRDPLTGAYNRRAFVETGEKILLDTFQKRRSILFCLVDIDHFKTFNDRYGHAVGDRVLIEIAKTIKNYLLETRKDDLIFRLGGEEFGLFVKQVSSFTEAEKIVEELLDRIRSLRIEDPQRKELLRVTVSVGCFYCTLKDKTQADLDWVYSFADRLMYQVKKSGRDDYLIGSCEEEDCLKRQ